MPRPRPLSIQSSLGLAVAITVASTVLGLLALFGYQFNLLQSRAGEVRALALADACAAQLRPLLLAGRHHDTPAFIDRLTLPPDCRFLALLDQDHRTLAVWGPRELLERAFELISRRNDRPQTLQLQLTSTQPPSTLSLAVLPLPSDDPQRHAGTLLLAIQAPDGFTLHTQRAWSFLVGIAAIAAVGFALGFLYLHYSVVRPLVLLSRRSRQPAPKTDEPIETRRLPDELETLARTLTGLQMDLDQWRRRSDRLQHDFAVRIQTETASMTRELRRTLHKAWTDPLTRLGNRRLLDEKLDDIFRTRQRAGENLAVVMIDLDHFKKLNDTLGHTAGDDLLRFIGDLLRQCVREEDLAIRYGGDEFLLILPNASAAQARAIAERAVRLFAQQTRLIRVEPRPSMSAGVAAIREHQPASPEQLLRQADAALYQAKKNPSTRVAVFNQTTQ
mgnify:CR=1 FL=1